MSKYNSWLGLNRLEVLKKSWEIRKQREIRMSVYLAADVDEITYESEIESVCVADKWYYLKTCGNKVVRKMYQIHFLRWKGSCFFGCDLRLKKWGPSLMRRLTKLQRTQAIESWNFTDVLNLIGSLIHQRNRPPRGCVIFTGQVARVTSVKSQQEQWLTEWLRDWESMAMIGLGSDKSYLKVFFYWWT